MKARRTATFGSLTALLLLGSTRLVRPDDVPARVTSPAPTEAELAQADHELEMINDGVSCSQSCSSRSCSPTLFSPYTFARGEMRIGAGAYARIRPLRGAMIQRLGVRLLPALRGSVEIHRQFLAGAHYLSGDHEHLLMVLLDLNAVEALPLLLEALAEAERLEMAIARLQVLSTITGILRQEGYRPLLESALERQYGEALAAYWKKRAEQDESALAWGRANLDPDPVHGLPQVHWFPMVQLELTPELRAQLETWARDFLASTPVGDWKGAAGMSPRPVTR